MRPRQRRLRVCSAWFCTFEVEAHLTTWDLWNMEVAS